MDFDRAQTYWRILRHPETTTMRDIRLIFFWTRDLTRSVTRAEWPSTPRMSISQAKSAAEEAVRDCYEFNFADDEGAEGEGFTPAYVRRQPTMEEARGFAPPMTREELETNANIRLGRHEDAEDDEDALDIIEGDRLHNHSITRNCRTRQNLNSKFIDDEVEVEYEPINNE